MWVRALEQNEKVIKGDGRSLQKSVSYPIHPTKKIKNPTIHE